LETLVGQFEHTTGTNGFFVRLKCDLDSAGGRLLRWLSASEAAQSFTFGERPHWIRPDGSADIHLGGHTHRIFLECDRGTVGRLDHLTQKFQSYANYFASQRSDCEALLIVTPSPHREAVIWRILNDLFPGDLSASVFTTVDSLLERLGCLAPIWLTNSVSGRVAWQAA
jgi:hypothetical protein